MWKRINRQTERSIGSPTLVETTIDDQILRTTTNLNNGDFSISSRPAFGRKTTEDVLKGLPDLPLYVPRRVAGSVDTDPKPVNPYYRFLKPPRKGLHLRPRQLHRSTYSLPQNRATCRCRDSRSHDPRRYIPMMSPQWSRAKTSIPEPGVRTFLLSRTRKVRLPK